MQCVCVLCVSALGAMFAQVHSLRMQCITCGHASGAARLPVQAIHFTYTLQMRQQHVSPQFMLEAKAAYRHMAEQ